MKENVSGCFFLNTVYNEFLFYNAPEPTRGGANGEKRVKVWGVVYPLHITNEVWNWKWHF